MIYPISFSIAKSKEVTSVPRKTKHTAHIIPGKLDTYIYGADEARYYADYAASVFGVTHKKAGWDCMRHYEILANGCIPFFPGLEQCPKNTMVHFPRELVFKAMSTIKPTDDPNAPHIKAIVDELLTYTRNHLTTEAMARYVLDHSQRPEARSVLFLNGNLGVDYMRCLLLHGFKEIFGAECHDYPSLPHLYTDFPIDKLSTLYGRGMSVTRLLDKVIFRKDEYDKSIEEDIISHKYDIVVYGSVHRGLPFWNLVHRHYASKDVILICGEDIHNCNFTHPSISESHDLFLREQ